jgi:large subunit ribosomal protein L22
MQAVAKARFLRGSSRKMRQVIDLVRGKSVEDALHVLRFTRKKNAHTLEKIIRSAIANAIDIYGDEIEDPNELSIIEAKCDDGPIMKRIRARAMGRAYRIRKRTCHVKVVVGTKDEVVTAEGSS